MIIFLVIFFVVVLGLLVWNYCRDQKFIKKDLTDVLSDEMKSRLNLRQGEGAFQKDLALKRGSQTPSKIHLNTRIK